MNPGLSDASGLNLYTIQPPGLLSLRKLRAQGLKTRITGLAGKGSFPNSVTASLAAWRVCQEGTQDPDRLGPFTLVLEIWGFSPEGNGVAINRF